MSHPQARRPVGVSFIVILGVINGVVGMLGGLFVVLDRDDPTLIVQSRMTQNQLFFAGLLAIVFGAIVVYLSLVLARGSATVRMLFGLFSVIHLAGGLWALVALTGEQRLAGAWQIAFSVIVLWILFGTERSREFFTDI